MLDSELKINRFQIGYCRMMVGDIPDERMAEQPLPGVNHPAWILGHLAFSTDRGRMLLGLAPEFSEEWATKFGFGSKISSSRGDYPSRDELIQAFERGFEHFRDQVAAATPEQLGQPSTNPRMKEHLPTVKDGLAFLLTGHMAMHLGQFSAWRRMIGLPPLF